MHNGSGSYIIFECLARNLEDCTSSHMFGRRHASLEARQEGFQVAENRDDEPKEKHHGDDARRRSIIAKSHLELSDYDNDSTIASHFVLRWKRLSHENTTNACTRDRRPPLGLTRNLLSAAKIAGHHV